VQIPLVDVKAQYAPLQAELEARFREILGSGQFIRGPHYYAFQEEAAAFLGVSKTIGVGNGTDAIVIVLDAMEIGPGDELLATDHEYNAALNALRAAAADRGARVVLNLGNAPCIRGRCEPWCGHDQGNGVERRGPGSTAGSLRPGRCARLRRPGASPASWSRSSPLRSWGPGGKGARRHSRHLLRLRARDLQGADQERAVQGLEPGPGWLRRAFRRRRPRPWSGESCRARAWARCRQCRA